MVARGATASVHVGRVREANAPSTKRSKMLWGMQGLLAVTFLRHSVESQSSFGVRCVCMLPTVVRLARPVSSRYRLSKVGISARR